MILNRGCEDYYDERECPNCHKHRYDPFAHKCLACGYVIPPKDGK